MGTSELPEACAAVGPFAGHGTQAGCHRVRLRVRNEPPKRLGLPNHVVEGLLLPDSPGSAEMPIDLMGCEGLPRMEDPRQGEPFVWRKHGVIRKQAPCEYLQSVSLLEISEKSEKLDRFCWFG